LAASKILSERLTLELGLHVLLLQRLDRIPVELELLGDIADRCLSAAATDIESKAFGEMHIVRQKIQPFALHAAAIAARDAPHFQFQNRRSVLPLTAPLSAQKQLTVQRSPGRRT
jgi:hypothetical protein